MILTKINDVTFESNEGHISPQKINIIGTCECNNCGIIGELRAKDVTFFKGVKKP